MSRINLERRKIIEDMARAGVLSKAQLVQDAASAGHPWHDDKRWLWDDDSAAAARYRLGVAEQIIRSLVTVLPGTIEPVRSIVSLSTDRPDTYRHVADVLSDEDRTARLLEDARREAVAFIRKYRALTAVAGMGALFDTMESAFRSVGDAQKPD